MSTRQAGWTATIYESRGCGTFLFPGKSFQSAAVTQDCTPFPKFESGMARSVGWNSGDEFRLLLFNDALCMGEPVIRDRGCTSLESPDVFFDNSVHAIAFSVVNTTNLSTSTR